MKSMYYTAVVGAMLIVFSDQVSGSQDHYDTIFKITSSGGVSLPASDNSLSINQILGVSASTNTSALDKVSGNILESGAPPYQSTINTGPASGDTIQGRLNTLGTKIKAGAAAGANLQTLLNQQDARILAAGGTGVLSSDLDALSIKISAGAAAGSNVGTLLSLVNDQLVSAAPAPTILTNPDLSGKISQLSAELATGAATVDAKLITLLQTLDGGAVVEPLSTKLDTISNNLGAGFSSSTDILSKIQSIGTFIDSRMTALYNPATGKIQIAKYKADAAKVFLNSNNFNLTSFISVLLS